MILMQLLTSEKSFDLGSMIIWASFYEGLNYFSHSRSIAKAAESNSQLLKALRLYS
jgi:hypothetical protein